MKSGRIRNVPMTRETAVASAYCLAEQNVVCRYALSARNSSVCSLEEENAVGRRSTRLPNPFGREMFERERRRHQRLLHGRRRFQSRVDAWPANREHAVSPGKTMADLPIVIGSARFPPVVFQPMQQACQFGRRARTEAATRPRKAGFLRPKRIQTRVALPEGVTKCLPVRGAHLLKIRAANRSLRGSAPSRELPDH